MEGYPAFLTSKHTGAWGSTITSHSAAIIPRQWTGRNQWGASYRSFGPNTYGFLIKNDFSQTSWFNTLTDVVDNRDIAPTSLEAQDIIMGRAPGELVLEVPGRTDLGPHARVLLSTTAGTCPVGTTQVGG